MNEYVTPRRFFITVSKENEIKRFTIRISPKTLDRITCDEIKPDFGIEIVDCFTLKEVAFKPVGENKLTWNI